MWITIVGSGVIMEDFPRISDAEWQVMKVLWQGAPRTAGEIIEVLSPYSAWKPKTIHTLISRLVAKGAVEVQKEFPLYRYCPLVTEDSCRREETRSFLQKVYDGSFTMLMANFLKDEKLSEENIQALRHMLDNKMGEASHSAGTEGTVRPYTVKKSGKEDPNP